MEKGEYKERCEFNLIISRIDLSTNLNRPKSMIIDDDIFLTMLYYTLNYMYKY